MTWHGLVWKNLFRRPARTLLTAAGVSLGVALIVALLSITQGVHRTAGDLIHIGRADFGVFQSDVSDLTRSYLPQELDTSIHTVPGVDETAKVKIFVAPQGLVFGFDPREFAMQRFVIVAGRRPHTAEEAVVGDGSGHGSAASSQLTSGSSRWSGSSIPATASWTTASSSHCRRSRRWRAVPVR